MKALDNLKKDLIVGLKPYLGAKGAKALVQKDFSKALSVLSTFDPKAARKIKEEYERLRGELEKALLDEAFERATEAWKAWQAFQAKLERLGAKVQPATKDRPARVIVRMISGTQTFRYEVKAGGRLELIQPRRKAEGAKGPRRPKKA